jgi:type II secretory ATPase GspE/PulE/Tfp pilus assembly ATPase PilB-like protein/CheY-like chemotaxis protein
MAVHWLVRAARQGGATGLETLELAPGTRPAEAWARVCVAAGWDEARMATQVAAHFRLATADPASAVAAAARLIPEAVARRHGVLALRETDREITVATSDPTDLAAEQAIAFASGRQVVFEVAPPGTLAEAIESTYRAETAVAPLLRAADADDAGTVRIVDSLAESVAGAREGESSAVVRLTNLILRAAIGRGAHEVRFEPGSGAGAVLLAMDGVSRHFMQMPMPAMNHVVQRLRTLGNVGIASRRWTTTGAARIRVDGRTYDLLVAVQAEGGRQRARLRIIDSAFAPRIGGLGLPADDLDALRRLLQHPPGGLLVVTGWPGTGVTTLLYAVMREAVAGGRRVASVEPRLEHEVPGADQVMVDGHGPMAYAAAVRRLADRTADTLVLHDAEGPDAVVEATGLAAAGRLVLLGTRGPTAGQALRHLSELGVAGPSLAPVLRGVVTVCGVQRLCEACAVPVEPHDPSILPLAGRWAIEPARRAPGCDACFGTGCRGLFRMLDIVPAGPELSHALGSGRDPARALDAGRGGGRRAADQARAQVAAGVVPIQELDRVFGETHDGAAEPPSGVRILVADDDPLVRLLVRTLLEADALVVSEATDGHDALRQIGDGDRHALVLLDLDMPRLTGHDVLHRLRSRVTTAGVPVVVLTASTDPRDEQRAVAEGADDYIRKPIDPMRFLARIRAVLGRSSLQ